MTQPPAILDLVGLKCPLPVLRARKALLALEPGAALEVRASDPLAAVDIPNLARELGDVIAAQSMDGGVWTFLIERGGRNPLAAAEGRPTGAG